jgi:hypothetical protein
MTIPFENIPKLPSFTLDELQSLIPALVASDVGAIVYCSNAITNTGVGTFGFWNGTNWVNSNNLPLISKQSDFLNYTKNKLQYFTDCFSANAAGFYPFNGTVLSNGTVNVAATTPQNKPGIVRLRSGTNANSGYLIATNANSLILKGDEVFLSALIIHSVATTTVIREGFIDTINTSDCVDGVYFEITNGLIIAKTSTNNVRTSSPNTFSIVVNTYYWTSITINSNATLATFKIFNEAGTLLFTDTISTNIPTAINRDTGVGIIGSSSLTVATDLYSLDFMGFSLNTNRPLLNI